MQASLLLVSLCFLCVNSKTAEEWKGRVIYQILTDRFSTSDTPPSVGCKYLRGFCGGTWKGIQERLDYITKLGANAIWISPIVENTPRGYHGYWAKNIYEVNKHFGTKAELKELIAECHRRNVWVMADVVANHMGYPGDLCDWTDKCNKSQLQDFSGFTPFNRSEHFHTICPITDWLNQTQVELCWLANLPDLNQSNYYVRSTLLQWIRQLTIEYGFDGYRVDTVVEVWKPFWKEFQNAAGVFLLGEANNGDRTSYTADYQTYMDSVLNFPAYWALRKVFNENNSMEVLTNSTVEQRNSFKDMSVLGMFVDNHDFERFLNFTPDTTKLKNALTYVIMTEGIPVIYYGTEQAFNGGGDPNNRESLWPHYNKKSDLYKFIKLLNDYRRDVTSFPLSAPQEELYVNHEMLVFGRRSNSGNKFLAVISTTTLPSLIQDVTGLDKYTCGNTVYANLLNSDDRITIKPGITTKIKISLGNPKVYRCTKDCSCDSSASSKISLAGVLLLVTTVLSMEFN